MRHGRVPGTLAMAAALAACGENGFAKLIFSSSSLATILILLFFLPIIFKCFCIISFAILSVTGLLTGEVILISLLLIRLLKIALVNKNEAKLREARQTMKATQMFEHVCVW